MSNNLICFGDVVKLATKSSFVDSTTADADTFVGFFEHKKELLLVVPPVKEELKDKFLEAEFIIAPVRGDKPPQPGTPLNYKQAFVLKTSDGSGYSLNNKTPSMSEAVSLRECNVKGEMYLEVHKEGFATDSHVHDGDMNVELTIADSNRIRKTYNNKPLTHVTKAKSDTPGGVVSCSAKGRVLAFKLVKIADKTETRKFVKEPVFRRASQMLVDPVKADETSEASVLESPSRAGSIVTTGPLVQEDALASAPSSPKAATPETVAAVTPEAPVAETVAAPVETVTAPVPVGEVTATTTTTITTGVSPLEVAAQLQTVAVAAVEVVVPVVTEPEVPETATPIMAEETFTGLATIELSGASVPDMDAMNGSAPVHDKISVGTPRETRVVSSSPTSQSTAAPPSGEEPAALAAHEEPVDTACVGGKCSIM